MSLRPALPLIILGLAFPPAPAPPAMPAAPAAIPDSVAARIRQRLAGPDAGLLSSHLVARFYEGRAYAPAWSSTGAAPLDAGALARAIRTADSHGLRPAAYRLKEIEEALRRMPPGLGGEAADLAALDLLLSDAFLTHGRHLARGRIDPRTIHPGWSLPPRTADPVAALETAIHTGDVGRALAGLAPADPAYRALARALSRYRHLEAAGGWRALPAGDAIRPGDRGDAVAALRERLAVEVLLPATGEAAVYDPALEAGVRAFQRSHGLLEDGIVGRQTRAALNVTARARGEQIELAMERLRWLPADLGWRHIRVSIPAFELALVEEGRTVLAMRIVGGRPDWPTPVFSARMTSIVLSPYWNIPGSIAEREVVPEIRRDPTWLARNRVRVVTGYGAAERVVNPSSIDWSRYDPRRSPFRLRQDPGPGNSLGSVKFLFPNPYSTYLHDTPARGLFAEPVRAFSHGCMRAEKPIELAEILLADLGWDDAAIRATIAHGVERHVALADPVPVHVLYQTAWVDAAGEPQFRDDLYGHDRRLARALDGNAVMIAERPGLECVTDPEAGR